MLKGKSTEKWSDEDRFKLRKLVKDGNTTIQRIADEHFPERGYNGVKSQMRLLRLKMLLRETATEPKDWRPIWQPGDVGAWPDEMRKAAIKRFGS